MDLSFIIKVLTILVLTLNRLFKGLDRDVTRGHNDSRLLVVQSRFPSLLLPWSTDVTAPTRLRSFYFESCERKLCLFLLCSPAVGSGMWPGCIYASV